jgi:predicted LPLAT superfamily acyltransferase
MSDSKKKKRRGNGLGFLIFDLYLLLGIRHAYALLYFVALHYLIFDRKAVAVSDEYIRLRFKKSKRFERLKHIYRLFINAGKNLIDLRQLERDFNKVHIDCDTRRIREVVREGNGLLLLTAHVGNWQVMMRNLPDLGAKINIVMLPEENPAVREYLQIDRNETDSGGDINGLIPRSEINIIDPSRGADAVLEIVQELASGNIVSIMGDRIPPSSQTLRVDFLGESITLPEGPFRIAAVSKSPVLFLLTRRNGPCNYTMEINDITIPRRIKKKKEKIHHLGEKYAETLESFLESSPYEWSPAGNL